MTHVHVAPTSEAMVQNDRARGRQYTPDEALAEVERMEREWVRELAERRRASIVRAQQQK